MTQDEIRKLLGGYATNTLSADERRILFEAALEDQELFNAIEKEDALRELLDDPVSREQVRRSLATGSWRRPGFWSRRWILGVAVPAAIAVVLIVLMNRARAPGPMSAPVQVARERLKLPENATPENETSQQALQQKLERKKGAPRATEEFSRAGVRAKGPDTAGPTAPLRAPAPVPGSTAAPLPPATAIPESAAAARPPAAENSAPALASPAAPPVIPAPIRVEAARATAASADARFQIAAPASVSAPVRRQLAAAAVGSGALYQGPLVQYSVVRDVQDTGAVRVEVTSAIAGYLALFELDKAGGWERVYPANDVATSVMAGVKLQIPGSPIKIADSGGKLRLIVVPQAPAKTVGQLGGAVVGDANSAGNENRAVDATLSKSAETAGTPLVVEIPLRP